MSRRSLILCLTVIAAMIAGIGIAVAVLYSGTGSEEDQSREKVSDDSRYLLLPAVPSDAVLLCCLSDLSETFASGLELPGKATVSFHYSGKLIPLYVFDAGKASGEPSEKAQQLIALAQKRGMSVHYQDCSTVGTGYQISGRSVVVASLSESLVKASVRHLQKGVSILDAPGFATASSSVSAKDVLFIPNETSAKVVSALLTSGYRELSAFVPKMADWMAFDITRPDAGLALDGVAVTDGDLSDFVNVLDGSGTVTSQLASVLPSYTLSAAVLSVGDAAYIADYQEYLDAWQQLQARQVKAGSLEKEKGLDPVAFFTRLQAKEIATASFLSAGSVERVNLFRVSRPDSLKNYVSKVAPFSYPSYASLVFGRLFELPDESSFTFRDGWVITGSEKAVELFAAGKAAEYTLEEYLVNASIGDLFAEGQSSFKAYLSLTESRESLSRVFRQQPLDAITDIISDADCGCIFVAAGEHKHPGSIDVSVLGGRLRKSKPVAERNVEVVVPTGPFRVRNSGTGKMNLFYQQENLYLCLQEEGGKGLWGVPFTDPICGRASTIDHYANGKLQILFGAGTKLHLIDRLGRFVTGFPVDLKKDILIGPDVYDFNGSRRYNVMILHKDNTIEMYNLKGQKPASWSGIRPPEMVRDLPERILVGGNTFWVVRTSVQTLVYPFGGGEPLTGFQGDQMALPDSEVRIIDGSSVELQCYDGKSRSVKLK